MKHLLFLVAVAGLAGYVIGRCKKVKPIVMIEPMVLDNGKVRRIMRRSIEIGNLKIPVEGVEWLHSC